MLLFAACSAASSPSASTSSNTASGRDASSDVLLSAQQSVGAGTAQVDVTAQLNLPVLGEQTATGTGVVDFAAQKAQAQLDAAGIELDGVVDGDVAYLRSPLLGADTWYRMDTAGDNSGGLPDIWAQIVDPSQLFNSLQDASSSMVAVGSEQVNGVQATHYHGELDLQKAAQAAGGSTTNPNPNATAATDVPIDVWVDAQGLVTRVQVSLASTGDQGSQAGIRLRGSHGQPPRLRQARDGHRPAIEPGQRPERRARWPRRLPQGRVASGRCAGELVSGVESALTGPPPQERPSTSGWDRVATARPGIRNRAVGPRFSRASLHGHSRPRTLRPTNRGLRQSQPNRTSVLRTQN